MSFDPYAPDPEPYSEGMADEPAARTSGRLAQIKARVQGPAISLMVVGILNLFWVLYMLANGILWTVAPDFVIDAEKRWSAAFQNQGTSREQQQLQGMIISYPLAVLALVSSVLSIAGGLRMLSLKSYTISVCGAVAAMLPCISCLACCGIGEGLGIWALIVLLNPDVKSAFQ